ncbi:hypothetical protein BKA93DRAFT_784417 [Sparassis latifolia]
MAGFLWLVWYEPVTRTSARHWTLAVTYEAHEQAYATFYEMLGSGSAGGYKSKVTRRVRLTSGHGASPYSGKILLGEIIDPVLGALEMYSETATDLVNSHNQKRDAREYNSQDWAIIIIRSLEDALLLPQGTLARVERCSKLG